MKMADVEAMGLTLEQYNQFFDEPIEDLPQETVAQEAAVEVPEFANEATIDVDTEAQMDAATVAETEVAEEPAETVAEAIVPTVTTATSVAGMEFKNMKAAAEYLATTLNLKVTNTLDCLYKCLKAKNHKTHKYAVERREDNTVVLTPLA